MVRSASWRETSSASASRNAAAAERYLAFLASRDVAAIFRRYADSAEDITVTDDSTLTFDATFNGGGDIIRFTGHTPINDEQVMLHSRVNRKGADWVGIDWRIRSGNVLTPRKAGQQSIGPGTPPAGCPGCCCSSSS